MVCLVGRRWSVWLVEDGLFGQLMMVCLSVWSPVGSVDDCGLFGQKIMVCLVGRRWSVWSVEDCSFGQ